MIKPVIGLAQGRAMNAPGSAGFGPLRQPCPEEGLGKGVAGRLAAISSIEKKRKAAAVPAAAVINREW
jgi:hypothetical protein